MTRSSAPKMCCLCMRSYLQLMANTMRGNQMRMVSSKGNGKGKANSSSRSRGTSLTTKKKDRVEKDNLGSKDGGVNYKALSSGRLSDDQLFLSTRTRKDVQPRITREENMWRDPNKMDTKWLNPRDPTRYKPNFKNTEPLSLRKQFMRSPDERSRDVLSRDWENAVKAFRDKQRQISPPTTLQAAYQAAAESEKSQRKAKLKEHNTKIDDKK